MSRINTFFNGVAVNALLVTLCVCVPTQATMPTFTTVVAAADAPPANCAPAICGCNDAPPANCAPAICGCNDAPPANC